VVRDERWKALSVIAAPASAIEAMALFLSSRGLPGRLVVGAMRGRFARAFGTAADTFSAKAMLPKVRVPVLVVHGSEDEVVPLAHGQEMASLVPERLRSTMWVEGADHRSVRDDPAVAARVAEFFGSAL
jgi:pimeloyl-ACP methyl ester carboxylesterase